MFGSNLRDFVSQDATPQGQSNSERLIKSWHGFEKPDSEDSGNCSEAEEEQNTNRATRLEFQLTQSLLSQVRADKNNADANSGKQAYKDLPRMSFIINGKTISKDFVGQLCDRYNQELQSNKRQVAKHVLIEMFKHAEAEVPDDSILEELVTNCNQAGQDGSLLLQLFPIFFEHNLQLPDANDRKISIICNSQDLLNVQYCPNMPVKKLDTNMKICRLDAILEFALKSQDGKVEYKDGKVTLAIPEQLKNYKSDGKSLLGDINRHFKDADNAVVESLIANIGEGPKSFVADPPAEVDSGVDNSFEEVAVTSEMPSMATEEAKVNDEQSDNINGDDLTPVSSPVSGDVLTSRSDEEEPVVITTRQPSDGEHDKTVSKEHQDDALEKDLIDFSSNDGNSLLGDPVPTSTNEIPEQEDDTQTNGKLPNNPENGSITATQNTKRYVIAASALAIAGIISGVAISVYLEMLAVGIAVGACCPVAAAVIYCCTPKSSVESKNVIKLTGDEFAAQQTVN